MNPVSSTKSALSACDTSILISACERGDLSELQRVLEESQLDIGSEPLDSKGQTALHIACGNGQLNMAQYLVNEKGCSVLVEDVYGHNPFVLSLINKHWKVADFLLTVAPNSITFKKHIGLLHYGESLVAEVTNEALTKSCSSGYFQLVRFLTKEYEKYMHISETYYVPFAIANDHWNIVLYLKIEKGDGDLSTVSPSHLTPLLYEAWKTEKWQAASSLLQHAQKRGLHESIGLSSTGLDQLIEVVPHKTVAFNIACSKGYLEVVKYLHEKGLFSHTELGGQAIILARSSGQMHIVHFLIKNCKYKKPDDMTELHAACIVGDEEKVKAALSSSESTIGNKTDQHGIIAMHYAAYSEPKVLSIIMNNMIKVDNRVSFNSLDKSGNTPLHFAVIGGCTESVRLLLQAPVVNINLVNCKGETPLHIACKQNETSNSILEMLVAEERCDLSIQDENGDTVLHIAVERNASAVELLTLHKNCNPSFANYDGMTPLQLASDRDQLSAAEVLVRCAKCSQEDITKALSFQGLLHRAMYADRMSLFMRLINVKEFNVNEVGRGGKTILHVACTVENMDYIQSLTQQPTCDLNIQDNNRDTALHIAARSEWNSAEKIQCILDSDRCDPNITNKHGYAPLHLAIMNNNVDSVKKLLHSAKCNPNIQDLQGNTALHLSIILCLCLDQMSATITKSFLMCDNVNVNIQNKKGNTPLHVAVVRKSPVRILKQLIKHPHCNPSIANYDGMTPLQLALNMDELYTAEIIVCCAKCSHDDIAKVLYRTMQADRMSLFMNLIQIKEFNINEVSRGGQISIHVACTVSNVDYIQVLTRQPTCDLKIQDENGDTALHIAACCEWNSTEKIQCILDSDRCDPNITNKQGYTPLHTATVSNQFYSVKKLLNSTKCNPNIQDIRGNTALHLSIDQKSATVIESFLMCDNVDVNIQNEKGNTPLHVAVIRKTPVHILKELISHPQCNPSIANHEGMTPLQIAFKIAQFSSAELLLVEILCERCSHEDIATAVQCSQCLLHRTMSANMSVLFLRIIDMKECNKNEVNHDHQTALHVACTNKNMKYIQALTQQPTCDLNIQDDNGDTALHIVCKMVNINTAHFCKIEILLENGADVQAVNKIGDAPIHIACNGLRLHCLKALLQSQGCDPNQQNADGDTALHLVCRMGENHDSNMRFIEALISTPGIDPEIANHAGLTPVEVAGTKYFVIQTLTNFLKHKQSSLQTYLKIFFVGNSGTGKSTLIKAVTTEASQLLKYAIFPKMKRVNPSDVPPHTAGIVPIPFNSKHFGHAVLYDFAGQHEYYSSHAAVMENLILPSPPLFLLLIDISKPLEKIKEEFVYWWQFINNHSQRAAAPPHVIFVASHKDIVRARGEDPQTIIDEIMENSVRDIQVSFTFEGSFILDCRKLVSQGLTALLTKLNTTCQVFRQNADVNLHCHILKAFLTTTELKELLYCQIFQILKKINSDDAFLPQSSFQLVPLLSTLSDQGHILLLQNHTDVNKSWVILKPEVLLAKVNGSIFAPDYFKEHFRNFAMSTGVVTFTKIREKFTGFNHEVIIEFLIHLEFCFRIKDKHTLEIITKNEVSLINQASEYREEYYFFPALVRNENPEDVCLPQETDMYQCGWFYKCGKETEQLTTRLLHVLILRLAFSCEPPDDPTERESVVLLRSCSVWKHGIAWWTDDGIETIVEVGLQCRWVAVLMRCPETHKVQCAELRSKVIAIVLKAKQDFCQATKINGFLIAPSCLRYPFEGRELTLYSMKKIASVVVEGKDFVKDIEGKNPLVISQLLPFEPYYKLEYLIGRFFTTEQSLNEEISPECLEQIAMKCHKNLRDFETALQPNLIAYEEECSRVGGSEVKKCVALFCTLKNNQKRPMKTWRDFEHVFRRFSIFCGRNPMDIAAGRSDSVGPHETRSTIHLASGSDQELGDSERNLQDSELQTPVEGTAAGAVEQSVVEEQSQSELSEPLGSDDTHTSDDDNTQTGTDAAVRLVELSKEKNKEQNIGQRDSQQEKQAMLSSIKTADTLLKGEKPSLKDLTNAVVPETSSEWHALGLQLNITKARLDAIQTDYPRDCRRCCTEMLSEWLSQDAGASWPTLIAALGSRAVDKTELAGCLDEYHMSASS